MLRLALIAVSLTQALASPTEDWRRYARKLGPSELGQQDSVAKVRAIPNLATKLATALEGPDRYLALEVIVALEMKETLPKLLELARTDENGAFYLSINALLTAKNAKAILNEYRIRLTSANAKSVAFPVKVILLDTLGRTNTLVSEPELKRLMDDPYPEVRSAVIYYIRLTSRASKKKLYASVLNTALKDAAPQLRLQATHTAQDIERALGEKK